ncbi:MAG: glycyl-radical enzyme activating protein [Deltaproteobacteria bacterium]|nr:glycyl-radical enzyme activating protein [Deltaproteobacteria bacterium]
MSKDEKLPLIFDIHHFALDDGPGIRTTVFLKGCPLSCLWCHNPESMKSSPEIAFYSQLCIESVEKLPVFQSSRINCGDCKAVCPEDAISFEKTGSIIRDRCTACGKCAEECPTTALKIVGKYYSVSDLIEILLSDHIFYETSKGGVTFSGGEPTLYMDYVGEVMKGLKAKNIHIAIETSGMFNLAEFKTKLLPYIDLIFYDLKLYDPHKHEEYTGKSNKQILSNLADLVKESSVRIIPRLPLVPKITATTDNLTQIARFLKGAGITTCELLPYNPGGIAKRMAIGKNVPSDIPRTMMGIEEENEIKRNWKKHFRS